MTAKKDDQDRIQTETEPTEEDETELLDFTPPRELSDIHRKPVQEVTIPSGRTLPITLGKPPVKR